MIVNTEGEPVHTTGDQTTPHKAAIGHERQLEIYDDAEIKKRRRRARSTLVAEAKFHRRPALKAVLVALWDFTGANDFCWPSQEKLAERCGYSPNSRRALESKLYELQKMGVIHIERGRKRDGTWSGNKYRIDFDRLADFCEAPPPLPESEETGFWSASMRLNERMPCAQVGACHALNQAHPSISKNLQRTATEPNEEWNQAAAALGNFGLERVKDAIRISQDLGISADRVLKLVEIAKSAGTTSKGWRISPGILFDRLKNDSPGRDPETGWHPDAQAALKLVHSRTAEVSKAIQSAVKDRVSAERAAEDRERLAIQESHYGPIIDGMDDTDFFQLCEDAKLNQFQLRVAKKSRRAPLARPELIKYLQAKEIQQ